jgi:hypothetical protein
MRKRTFNSASCSMCHSVLSIVDLQSSELANLTWWAILARCRWCTAELIRCYRSACIVEVWSTCRIAWVDVLLLDMEPARRCWVTVARLLLDRTSHGGHRIRNVLVSSVANDVVLQSSRCSQWNVWRSNQSDRCPALRHPELRCCHPRNHVRWIVRRTDW